MKGNLRAWKTSLERGMSDPLTSGVYPLKIPLVVDEDADWKPMHLFQGSTSNLHHLSCHVSALKPGCCPHPPHSHTDEEILLMLDGEVDLIFPDKTDSDGVKRHRLRSGQLVYYPAGFAHTIETVGPDPAGYLMLRWNGETGDFGDLLGFRQIDTSVREGARKDDDGFHATRIMEGSTGCLRKLQGHVSILAPGAGYDPHADAHDVVIIVLEGEVETLARRVSPSGVIFYRAGEPHGMQNPGAEPARYLVVEFHGADMPFTESAPVRMLVRIVRSVLSGRLRRRIRRVLSRLGRRMKP